MKTKIIKLLFLGLFTLSIIYSCKKTNIEPIIKEEFSGIEKAKQRIAKQMNEYGGTPQIFTINQRVAVNLVDMQGRRITKEEILNNNLVSTCASDIPDYVDLKHYVRIYQCASAGAGGYGFKIQFEFHVSWNNNVVLENPNNSSNKTKGRVRITHPTYGVVFDKTTFNARITDLGVDPVNSSNNIYSIKFTCDDLALAAYINDTNYTLRLAGTFVSDCSSLDQYALTLSDPAGWGFSPGSGYSPCARNEKAWFLHPGDIGQYVIGVAGYNVASNSCDYGGSFIVPDLQEAQYSLNNGSTWIPFMNKLFAGGLGIYNTKFVRYNDFAESATLSVGTHDVIIRYKNWKFNSAPSGSWPTPTTGTACRTYGNDLDNSYAYEYWPGIVVQ